MMYHRRLLHLASRLLLISPTARANNDAKSICYNIDGSVSTISYRCDNTTTGHTTCCQPGATCYSNGVCKIDNQGVIDYQRVGCTDKSWRSSACLKRCGRYVRDASAGIRPCDGDQTPEDGNHYCCDDGSDGIGSYKCCSASTSIFVVGTSLPTVLAEMALSQPSTSTTPTTTADSGTGNNNNAGNKDGGGKGKGKGGANTTAIGLGVGLGVGVPLLAGVVAALWFFVWRTKRQEHASALGSSEFSPMTGPRHSPPGSNFHRVVPGSEDGGAGGGGSSSSSMGNRQSAGNFQARGYPPPRYADDVEAAPLQELSAHKPVTELPAENNRLAELPP